MAKVTMQDIADALSISRVSVWKVFNGQPGVSDKLKKQVQVKAEELGYFNAKLSPTPSEPTTKTIAVIVSRPQSATFWTSIIFQISEELSNHNINLMYATVASEYSPSFALPTTLTDGTVDGAIILNIYDTKILHEINGLALPKVFLDITADFPTRDIQGDLFILEGYESVFKITESAIAKGCKEIGFIGNTNYAKTNLDRFTGFTHALETHDLPLRKEYCLIDDIKIHTYYEQMTAFFDALKALPDAFICASDHVASFLYQYFAAHPEKLTKDILVTGFDGSDEYLNVAGVLTTAFVDTKALGKRLAYQIRFREENPKAQFELTYIYPEIIYRDNLLKVKR